MTIRKEYFKELADRNTITPMLKVLRDSYTEHLLAGSLFLMAMYHGIKMYKRIRAIEPQGALEPHTPQEVDERDSRENVWAHVEKVEFPYTNTSRCSTVDDVIPVIYKNLLYGTVIAKGIKYRVHCLFLKSNLVILPKHYFYTDEVDIVFRKRNADCVGGKFRAKLSLKMSYHIPNTDLCICYCPNGGSFRDITKWLPMANVPGSDVRVLWRNIDGSESSYRGLSSPDNATNGNIDFEGGIYSKLSGNTFDGMCGAVVLSSGKGVAIAGIHLAGCSGTPRGSYGVLTYDNFLDGVNHLKNVEGVLITGSASPINTNLVGLDIENGMMPHKKSAINYIPEENYINFHGSLMTKTNSRSDVRVTPISEHIVDVMGKPNIYCAPQMKPEWKAWQTCMQNMAKPGVSMPSDLLEVAVLDYKSALYPIFESELWRDCKPLSDDDNACGVVGKLFIDPIKLDTAMGTPWTGKKREYVIELEPTEKHPNNKCFIPEVMDKVYECEMTYLRGHRANLLAKGCKKDEVLTAEKCRIFYANSFCLVWLLRKYYLPLIRVLMMNPLASECAVGVNCHGPEWDVLYNHIIKNGEDRILGGDYSKYDQKIPSQLILAALRILIDFAKVCNYTDSDIAIMEAMAGDVVYSYINMNGDIIGLVEGGHISGNSLTVILNSIVGSLNLRCAFYSKFPYYDDNHKIMHFRDYVSLITYGDDNIGSISPEVSDKFNIKEISLFLEEYGQTYTMPDKNSKLSAFLPLQEFEFLKRKSVYHDALKTRVGALNESSILKSLHCYIRTKETEDSEDKCCARNIDTALSEYFNHGPEVYEYARDQLKEVARRANIYGICDGLNLTYEDRVHRWFKRYTNQNGDK